MTRAFLASLRDTADYPDIEVVAYTDDDDPDSHGIACDGLRVTMIVGPAVTMGSANSACLARASGNVIILANDDIVVRTPGWDTQVRDLHARFPDQIYLAWPNDGFTSGRISTFPILSRRTCELLIEPYPAAYRGAWIDTDLREIFIRLRRQRHDRLIYLRAVLFEHYHPRTGKRAPDDTSRRRQRWADDGVFLARRQTRQRQAERLVAVIEEVTPPERLTDLVEAQPRGFWASFVAFAAAILPDSGLPLPWRLYLFIWYCGRHVGARLGW